MENIKNAKPDYDLLVQQVKALGEEENYWLPVLANTSALLMNALPDLNWAGFYLMNRDSLVLGPFQGNPACIRIPLCAGVCGAAALQDKVQRVFDDRPRIVFAAVVDKDHHRVVGDESVSNHSIEECCQSFYRVT